MNIEDFIRRIGDYREKWKEHVDRMTERRVQHQVKIHKPNDGKRCLDDRTIHLKTEQV